MSESPTRAPFIPPQRNAHRSGGRAPSAIVAALHLAEPEPAALATVVPMPPPAPAAPVPAKTAAPFGKLPGIPVPVDPFWMGELLVKRKTITPEQLRGAMEAHKGRVHPFVDTLLLLGLLTPAAAAEMVAERHNLATVDLSIVGVDPKVARELPASRAKRVGAVPFRRDNGAIHVAVTDPQTYPRAVAAGDLKTEHITYFVAPRRQILALIEEVSRAGAPAANASELLAHYLNLGVKKRASDMHLEPKENNLEIRYRIDGELVHEAFIDNEMKPLIVNAAMIASGMNPSEVRLPQDGQAKMTFGAKTYTFRVSTAPTNFGLMATLRVLDDEAHARSFADQGLSEEAERTIRRLLKHPDGILLSTGPTGSGKTTFTHCALDHLHSPSLKIITIEDPIEYTNPRYCQSQVKPDIGYGFSEALRTALRHDPDIIYIGEIRDRETAMIAIRSALTGHLVFGTLHTNSGIGAIPRLIDMEVPPFLIASSLRGVVGQRLVRRLCTNKTCSQPHPQLEHLRHQFNLPTATFRVHNPEGCEHCRHRGFIGRVGIFEVFPLEFDHSEQIHALEHQQSDLFAEAERRRAAIGDGPAAADALRALEEELAPRLRAAAAAIDAERKKQNEVVDLIHRRAPDSEIAAVYRRRGFKTMLEDGVQKAAAGITTLEEVYANLG